MPFTFPPVQSPSMPRQQWQPTPAPLPETPDLTEQEKAEYRDYKSKVGKWGPWLASNWKALLATAVSTGIGTGYATRPVQPGTPPSGTATQASKTDEVLAKLAEQVRSMQDAMASSSKTPVVQLPPVQPFPKPKAKRFLAIVYVGDLPVWAANLPDNAEFQDILKAAGMSMQARPIRAESSLAQYVAVRRGDGRCRSYALPWSHGHEPGGHPQVRGPECGGTALAELKSFMEETHERRNKVRCQAKDFRRREGRRAVPIFGTQLPEDQDGSIQCSCGQ